MTQAFRAFITDSALVTPPIPFVPATPIHITSRHGCVIETVPTAEGWLVRECDPKTGLIRESTKLLGHPRDVHDAWWGAWCDGPPFEFEAWIEPLWATPIDGVAVYFHSRTSEAA